MPDLAFADIHSHVAPGVDDGPANDAESRAALAAMEARLPHRTPDEPFFPGRDGHTRCKADNLYWSFRRAIEIAGIPHRGRSAGPRLHDLRHTFAVLRLLRWFEEGADLSAKLPYLATYLGHVNPTCTYWYLTAVPELLAITGRRFERYARQGGLR